MELLLKKYFGYDKFRPQQLEIINNVLENKDTLVLMPTGGGKSLCFQIPALKFKGLTIVISPLISLMKDQVDSLKLNGIQAEYINSSLSLNEIKEIKSQITNNEIKILYIAPERLALKDFQAFLSKINISLIAIDEAHCISEWGHDFRKDYRNLKHLKTIFPNKPIIALTATATTKVKDDILKQLNLTNPKVFISSFNRDNLNLIIREKKNSFIKILNLVEKNKNESIIIYCHSRKDTETIAKDLNRYGLKAIVYHAGLSTKLREKNQELFIADKVNVIVATIAFGMGIDKSNVRLVIHETFSKSIESYYQEIGRAGRDGLPSECILFYSKADIRKHEFFINIISDGVIRKGTSIKLNEMIAYCENKSCRRKQILEYFGENFLKENCGSCDICLNLPQVDFNENLTKKKVTHDTTLFEELRSLRKKIAEDKKLIPSLIFSDVSLREMAKVFPKTNNEFIKISGVGEQKLKEFGEDFLIIINKHIEVNEIYNRINNIKINENQIISKTKKIKKTYKTKKKKTTIKYNEILFKKLKILRKEIADKKGVQAFMIFSDTSLKEMSYHVPRSEKTFLEIKGVGPKKLEDYGSNFLTVISSHKK